VIEMRYGLNGRQPQYLDEVGAVLGVTRERVRQLRDRALKRLRQGAVGEVLRDLSAA
jgi:RNA polymerase primary sigma factor